MNKNLGPRVRKVGEIRQCFEMLKDHSVDPHNYSGLLFDVLFEIITADTCIAGISSRTVDGEVIEVGDRFLLACQT